MSTLLRRYSQYLPWFFWGIPTVTGLYLVSLQSYLLFHSLIEIFSIVIAFSIFIIAWNTRRLHENDFFLFIGIAYFFTGSLDLLHTLSYKGMGIFQHHDANLPTQLWISARYLESVSLLLAPLFFRKKPIFPCVIGIYLLLFSVLLGAVFYWHIFPDCFVEGSGLTQFKIGSEYFICVLLLLATAHLLYHRQDISQDTLQLLVASLVFTILAELSFTLYFSVYGYANMVGHYCKLLSFYCLYKALVCSGLKNPIELLFRNLEEKAERYQNLYDYAPLPYQSLDEKGHFIEVNATWLNTTGYTRGEVLGRSFGDFIGAEWQDHFKANFSRFIEMGEVLGVEFELRKKDRSFIPVRFNGKISYDKQGNFKQTHCMFQDISRQRLAENALKKSEKKYRRFFSTVNNGWAYHRVVTDEKNRPVDYIFLEINEAFEKLTGLVKKDIIGKRVTKVLPGIENDPAGWIEIYGKVALSGNSISFENYSEAMQKWYSVSASCPEKGYFIVVFEDITARKQAEKELLHTMKELQDANAELTQFNSAVAHDLKAPIRALSNYAAFLQEDLAQVASGESKKYLSRLRQTAVETGRMVEDLLLLAKISKQKEELVEIEVGDFMKKLISSMDLSPDIEISIGSDWPSIMTDPMLLRQVFQNLIDNAAKFTLASHKRIEIGYLSGKDGDLTIFVRDNGIGIGAAYHKQIFDLFERLHTPKEYVGTGVGLAIVKKAVNRLGGTIRLESTEGQGTSFYVTLPVEPDSQKKGTPYGF